MDQYITNRTSAPKKQFATNLPKVTDDALQPGGTLEWWINHENPNCPKPVTSSVVACQIYWWASGEKVIAIIQYFILFYLKLCVKRFTIFHMRRTLVVDKQTIKSKEKYSLSKGKNTNNQNCKGNKNNKSGKTAVLCCSSGVEGGRCEADDMGRDWYYGIGPVGG